MTPREELDALRRLAELEAKAGTAVDPRQKADADAYAGGDVSQMGALERGAGGASSYLDQLAFNLKSRLPQSVQDAGDWVDQKLGSKGINPERIRRAKAFDEESGTAGAVGGGGAQALTLMAPGGAITKGLQLGTRALPLAWAAATRLAGELGAGAGLGAITSAPGEGVKGAKEGAIGSGIGLGINRVLGGAVRPLITPEAQRLMDRGIQPTMGQVVGGIGNKLEEGLSSIPFIGGAIKNARGRAVDEFNQAAIQNVAPGVRGIGDEAIAAARDSISAQYDRALSRMPAQFHVDHAPIIQATSNAARDPALGLSQDSQRRLTEYVQQNLLDRAQNLTPEIAKRIESDMGKAYGRLLSSANAEDRALGEAMQQIHGQWRQSLTDLGNLSGRGAGTALREADAAYRGFLPVDNAAGRAGSQNAETTGRFTPRALRRSIEQQDKSLNNRATRFQQGQGNSPFGRLNALTRDAQEVLPDRVPDSGTTGRAMLGGALGSIGLGAATGNTTGLMLGGAGLAGSHALYSRPGQVFATQGFQPAVDALVAQGVLPAIAVRFVQEYGPEAILAGGRAAAMRADQK
jgi:hypothetical protein